jgi:hypothetical protein
MEQEKRIGQRENESSIEWLRRAIGNCDYEHDAVLAMLPSTEAVLEFFELWHTYDTDLWDGIIEQIQGGEDASEALRFCAKYGLSDMMADVYQAALEYKQMGEESEV